MHRSELQHYPGDEPIWGFIAQLGAERFTGQADVGSATRLHLFAREGRVYVAETDGTAPLGTRLVDAGALHQGQLDRGQVQLGNVVSLARLFHREPTADPDLVQVALAQLNGSVLEASANDPVGTVTLFPLRHHDSGAHLWDTDLPPLREVADDDPDAVALIDIMRQAEEPSMAELVEHVIGPAAATSLGAAPALVLPKLGTAGTRVAAPTTATASGLAQYTPSALETIELPKLSAKPMSMGEITAAQAVLHATTDATPDSVGLATNVIPTFESMLDATPTSWPAPAEPAEPTEPTEPAATEEIWEMVDEMLGIPHSGEQPVTPGGQLAYSSTEDKKARSWLRGRRG